MTARRTNPAYRWTKVVPVLLAGSLTLLACGSKAGSTTVKLQGQRSAGTVPQSQIDELTKDGRVGVADAGGHELEGLSLDVAEQRGRIRKVADRMAVAKRNLTEVEARAFMFTEPVPVTDDATGRVVGYWADRYYPLAEFDAARPAQERIVARVIAGS
ncbi:hypothetical protein KSP35_06285 [Aquihabitans sp. G128]|uniref:hypothetical protein n=1 Tax=Aquihabitans sp. G128 TaxID=2849779 RepID=UPI001C2310C1|nr:hypothetical protein [Aquihabitans sp. G128]QXC62405.1 hypothetical protein KSP35_06285 [Aquihabitans sp. G128]